MSSKTDRRAKDILRLLLKHGKTSVGVDNCAGRPNPPNHLLPARRDPLTHTPVGNRSRQPNASISG